MRVVKSYLAAIGRRGGLKSRRVLHPDIARRMVAVREAGRAYRRFHASCFSLHRADRKITQADVAWVAGQLMMSGKREAQRAGERLSAPVPSPYALRDVSPVVAERQAQRYRAMSPAEKLALADGMWDLAWDATVAGVRMRNPALDRAAVESAARALIRDASH